MRLRLAILIVSASLAAASYADDFSYAGWTAVDATHATSTFSTVNGPVTATLTGTYSSIYKNTGDDFNPLSSFTGGIVGNAPTTTDDVIRLETASRFTLSFSKPVTNLAYQLWSVGAPGNAVSYAFTQPFSVVAGGINSHFGGSALTQNGNTVSGQEGNGTLLFTGTYSNITWDVIGAESYQEFTIGLQKAQTFPNTPEPASFAALGLGVVAMLRRRKKA